MESGHKRLPIDDGFWPYFAGPRLGNCPQKMPSVKAVSIGRLDFQQRSREKQAARDADAADLASGRRTPGFFPREMVTGEN